MIRFTRLSSILKISIFLLISNISFGQTQYAILEITPKKITRSNLEVYSVVLDLGDSSDQLKLKNQLYPILKKKKSIASMLNIMGSNNFDLFDIKDSFNFINGTNTKSTKVFFFKKTE